MRSILPILLIVSLCMISCKKKDEIPVSGVVTIDNTTGLSMTYFVYGFLFSGAEIVSTLNDPPPDITVDSDGAALFFQTNNLKDSFYIYGEYENAGSAEEAFNNLTTVSVSQWTGLAYPVEPDQVWIYRSGSEHYAKIRIVSIVSEDRDNHDYAECTFEWVYQPDGSLTFPGK
jgi:hypothetical protein